MEMAISSPGGQRVDAKFGSFTVKTDQPPLSGGEASAPTPFATFLASIGTYAGIYVLGFCSQRDLPTDGIRIVQSLKVSIAPRYGCRHPSRDPRARELPDQIPLRADPIGGAVSREEASGNAAPDRRRNCRGRLKGR
jgi:hypothetical protein